MDAINPSEGIGKEEEAMGVALNFRESFDYLKLIVGDDGVEWLWMSGKGRPTRPIFCWQSVTDLPFRTKMRMKYSTNSKAKSHNIQALSSRGTHQMSAGNPIQQRGNSPGGSWSMWMRTS